MPTVLKQLVSKYVYDYHISALNHCNSTFATSGTNIFFDHCDRGIPVTKLILPMRQKHQETSSCRQIYQIIEEKLVPVAHCILKCADFEKTYCDWNMKNLVIVSQGWHIEYDYDNKICNCVF
jgi:hypothetical protein